MHISWGYTQLSLHLNVAEGLLLGLVGIKASTSRIYWGPMLWTSPASSTLPHSIEEHENSKNSSALASVAPAHQPQSHWRKMKWTLLPTWRVQGNGGEVGAVYLIQAGNRKIRKIIFRIFLSQMVIQREEWIDNPASTDGSLTHHKWRPDPGFPKRWEGAMISKRALMFHENPQSPVAEVSPKIETYHCSRESLFLDGLL